jgi:hypothetical protein
MQNFLVSSAGFSILGNGIFWWKAKTKRLYSQCRIYTALCVMLLMLAASIPWANGRGLGPGNLDFFRPWHGAV